MKQFFYFTFISILSSNVFGQSTLDMSINAPILTPQMIQYEIQKANSNTTFSAPMAYDADTPYVFNLKFYQINSPGCVNNWGSTFTVDNEVMDMVANLNLAFNPYNIFFKYRGFEFECSTLSTSGITGLNASTDFENQFDPNHNDITVVYANRIYGTGPFNDFPYNAINKTTHTVFIQTTDAGLNMAPDRIRTLERFQLVQNMGILFGLFYINSALDSTSGFYGPCENVNRGYVPAANWQISGDFLEDTPATPMGVYGNAIQLSAPCMADFTPRNLAGAGDCQNPSVGYINTLNNNFMDTTYPYFLIKDYGCSDFVFTPDQGKRMRNMITNSPAIFYGNSPLSNDFTNVKSLYKPYYREKKFSTNMPPRVTDNGNGTATVCEYFYYTNYKFQKGFDYSFPDFQSPDLPGVTTNQIPYVTKPQFNYPVTIAQLAPGQTNLDTNTGFVLNNDTTTICHDEPYNTGTKSSSLQIASPMIITESLTEQQLQDPNFYRDLESQRLYKITKETPSGVKTEEIFFKQ